MENNPVRRAVLLGCLAALALGLTAAVLVQLAVVGRPKPAPAATTMEEDSEQPDEEAVPRTTPEQRKSQQEQHPEAPGGEYGNHGQPERGEQGEHRIGSLAIPAIGLETGVYQTPDEMEAMEHGVAHFRNTSEWAGNVGLCGHNYNLDGTDGLFKDLHRLAPGDAVTYQTAAGIRTYTVVKTGEIAADDWSYLSYSETNLLTLITCVSGQPDKRLMVRAEET